MTEIKYCPFCHYDESDGFLTVNDDIARDSSLKKYFFVGCNQCGCSGPPDSTPEGAVSEWNSWREDPRKGE